jgi:hypothetical protein
VRFGLEPASREFELVMPGPAEIGDFEPEDEDNIDELNLRKLDEIAAKGYDEEVDEPVSGVAETVYETSCDGGSE